MLCYGMLCYAAVLWYVKFTPNRLPSWPFVGSSPMHDSMATKCPDGMLPLIDAGSGRVERESGSGELKQC